MPGSTSVKPPVGPVRVESTTALVKQPVAARLDENSGQRLVVLVDHGAGHGEAHGQATARPTVELVTRTADPFASTVRTLMLLGFGALVRKNREDI